MSNRKMGIESGSVPEGTAAEEARGAGGTEVGTAAPEPVSFAGFDLLIGDEVPLSWQERTGKTVSEPDPGIAARSAEVAAILEGGHRSHAAVLIERNPSLLSVPQSELTPDRVVELLKFPRILQEIRTAWGNPENFHNILHSYSVVETSRMEVPKDDPEGAAKPLGRRGFPLSVMSEIAALTHTHDELFGLPEHLANHPDLLLPKRAK